MKKKNITIAATEAYNVDTKNKKKKFVFLLFSLFVHTMFDL